MIFKAQIKNNYKIQYQFMLSKTPSRKQKANIKIKESPELKIIEVESSLTQLLTMQKILAKQIQQMELDETSQEIITKATTISLQTKKLKADFIDFKKDIQKELKFGFLDIKNTIQSGLLFLTTKINQDSIKQPIKQPIKQHTVLCQSGNVAKKNASKQQLQNFYENIKKKCQMKNDPLPNYNYQSSPIKILIAQSTKNIEYTQPLHKNQQFQEQICSIKKQIKENNNTEAKHVRSPSVPRPLRRYPSSNSLSTKQEPIKNSEIANIQNRNKFTRVHLQNETSQSNFSKNSTIRQLINAGSNVEMIQRNIFNGIQIHAKKYTTGTLMDNGQLTQIRAQEMGAKKYSKNSSTNEYMNIRQQFGESHEKGATRQRSTKKLKVFSRI